MPSRIKRACSNLVNDPQRLWTIGLAALPNLILFFALPPIWNYIDSYVTLNTTLDLIPHHPPVYPYLAKIMRETFGGVNDASVWAMIVFQHVLAVWSVYYLVTAFESLAIRGWLVSIGAVAASFHVYSHGIFTEGVAGPLLFFVVGAMLRVALVGPNRHNIQAYYLAALFCVLTRHALAVLLMGLPVLLVLVGSLTRNLYVYRQRFIWAVVAGLLVLIVSSLVTRTACFFIGTDPTSILGRAGVYRMQSLDWSGLKPQEKEALIAAVESRLSGPIERAAVRIMIEEPNPWAGPYLAIERLLKEKGQKQNVDEVMNAVYSAFLRTAGAPLIHRILADAAGYYGPFNFRFYPEASAVQSVQAYQRDDHMKKVMGRLSVVQHVDLDRYRNLGRLMDFLPLDRVAGWHLVILTLGLLVLGLAAGLLPAGQSALIITLLITSAVYALFNSLATITIWRYVSPTQALVVLSFGLAIAFMISNFTAARTAAGDNRSGSGRPERG
ncbi:MAG: hypothetical protein AB1641_29170 [Thermodesulfobacteriota bacterium]